MTNKKPNWKTIEVDGQILTFKLVKKSGVGFEIVDITDGSYTVRYAVDPATHEIAWFTINNDNEHIHEALRKTGVIKKMKIENTTLQRVLSKGQRHHTRRFFTVKHW